MANEDGGGKIIEFPKQPQPIRPSFLGRVFSPGRKGQGPIEQHLTEEETGLTFMERGRKRLALNQLNADTRMSIKSTIDQDRQQTLGAFQQIDEIHQVEWNVEMMSVTSREYIAAMVAAIKTFNVDISEADILSVLEEKKRFDQKLYKSSSFPGLQVSVRTGNKTKSNLNFSVVVESSPRGFRPPPTPVTPRAS